MRARSIDQRRPTRADAARLKGGTRNDDGRVHQGSDLCRRVPMNTTRVLFATFVGAALCLATPAWGTECGPVARVAGDAPLPATVTTLLLEQGVAPAATHCDAVVATITHTDGGLFLRLEDAEGRREEHLVANPAVAAVVIESWVRDDLYASLLPTPAPAVVRATPRKPVPSADPTHISIGFSANAGGANDGSLWAGGAAAACVRLDFVCVGAMVRFISDVDWTGTSARLQSNRQGYEGALTADFPLELRGIPLVPGLGLGFRTLENVADEDISDRRVAVQSSGLLVETHVRAYVPMDEKFLLEFTLGLDLYPTAHADVFRDSGIELAGEPVWSAYAGAGFRIGEW